MREYYPEPTTFNKDTKLYITDITIIFERQYGKLKHLYEFSCLVGDTIEAKMVSFKISKLKNFLNVVEEE